MAQSTVQSYVRLIATSDGSTLAGTLRVDGMPLIQRYTEGTSRYSPDFESANVVESDKPTVYPVIRDQATGKVLIPNSYTWKYNDVPITFNSSGLSTNSGMAGMFKRIDNYNATIDGKPLGTSSGLQALRVMKNLASATNHDNDRITLDGTVEFGGGGSSVSFKSLHKDVVIQQGDMNGVTISLSNDYAGAFTESVQSITEKVTIYNDGTPVDEDNMGAYTYEWFVYTPTAEVALKNNSTTYTAKVVADDIGSYGVVCCRVSKDGAEVGTGYDNFVDYTDEYGVRWDITGVSGDKATPADTNIVVKPVVMRRRDGADAGLSPTWDWATYDNAGNAFKLTGQSAATFSAKSVTTNYNEIVSASGCITFVVAADL